MIPAGLPSLAPLAVLALTGVIAMALSPILRARTLRRLTAIGFVATLVLIAFRHGAPAAPATGLLADDATARFGAALVTLSGLAALGFQRDHGTGREAPALVALATSGALATVAATHAVTLFLGLEITTLALVVLFAFPLGARGLEAGYKYFLMAAVAAAALLLGLAFGLAATGGLDFRIWAARDATLTLGAGLLLAALAFKFSLAPFHMWAPDVFDGAAPSATALVGVVSKAAVAIVLVRLTLGGVDGPVWATGLAIAGAASAILGNLVALSQSSLLRMLGYSSIAHSGYMALVLGSGAALTGEAVLFYMAAYAPALVTALCVAGHVGQDVEIDDLRGLVWRDPLAGAALALALLSMAGLPPAVGFIGKVYIFSALAEAAAWPHLAAALLGSALAVFYYIRFALRIFARGDGPTRVFPPVEALVTGTAAALIVILGIYPEPLVALCRAAVPLP